MAKTYGLKAINDDETICTICGKVELKRVMWIVELDENGNEVGEEFHCGTTCGAKLLGKKVSEVTRIANHFDSTVNNMRRADIEKIKVELGANEIIKGFDGMTFQERRNSPEWTKLMAIWKQAAEIASEKTYIVNL